MHIYMADIHKSFGENQVLKGVDFELKAGEIHALMGENGAGKSTLMNILTGLHTRDQGKIIINGQEQYFDNPKKAEKAGITFIHQELNIWQEMTVLENLFIGKELYSIFGTLKVKEMETLAEECFKNLSVSIPLTKRAGDCSVGEQQMIEIAKALMTNAKVLIMDEPTAALTQREVHQLFDVIESLRKRDVAVVYISHRMEEIFEICNRITVMRDGIGVGTKATLDINFEEIVKLMVGRELTDRFPKRNSQIKKSVLQVVGLTKTGAFENISFEVKAGEIVSFSGLMGAGRTEIMRTIFGLDKKDKGELFVNGKKVVIKTPAQAVDKGIGFITENRKDEGLILDFSIRDNITLPTISNYVSNGMIQRKLEDTVVNGLIKKLWIKTETSEKKVGRLSGGNQQKVVIAKWIGLQPKVLILDEPTRGVDVGAKREIYQLMNELTAQGVAIIMVSSELPEVLGMSDRIIVVHEGKISGELKREHATQEKIMTLATGGEC